MAATDPDTRARVSAAGGRARMAVMRPDERSRISRAGAAAIHSVPGLARRLVTKWRAASEEERAEALAVLAEGDVIGRAE